MSASDVAHKLVHSKVSRVCGTGSEDHRRNTTPQRSDALSETHRAEVLRERRQRCPHCSADSARGSSRATSDVSGSKNLHAGLNVSFKSEARQLTLIESTGKMAACSEIPACEKLAVVRPKEHQLTRIKLRASLLHSADTHHSSGGHVDAPSIAGGKSLILVLILLVIDKVLCDLALDLVDVGRVWSHVKAARRTRRVAHVVERL